MEHLLYLLIGLVLGVSLGMGTMGLLAAADRERLPEPTPGQPGAGQLAWPEVHDPSLEGIADPTHRTSGPRVAHSA